MESDTRTIQISLGAVSSNCYLRQLENGKCILVDIGEGAAQLQQRLRQLSLQPIAILLTHGHYDHIAGVEQIRKAYDIPVYIHALDAGMLTDSRANLGDWISEAPFRKVTAFETVTDGETLTFENVNFTVLHTPGHTPGSVCWMCENVLYTGDTLFRLSRGRTDFPGGSDAQMRDSLRKLKALTEDYTVYPGHEGTTTLAFEKAHNPNMQGL